MIQDRCQRIIYKPAPAVDPSLPGTSRPPIAATEEQLVRRHRHFIALQGSSARQHRRVLRVAASADFTEADIVRPETGQFGGQESLTIH